MTNRDIMSEYADGFSIDFEKGDTIIGDLIEEQRQRLVESVAEKTEQYLREVIATTDWEVVEVVDVVKCDHPVTPDTVDAETICLSEHPMSFEIYPYESFVQAPMDDGRYDSGVGHNRQVFRLTEEVCREIGVDPETGEDVE